jgi:hypothetical protein
VEFRDVARYGFLLLLDSGLGNLGKLLPVSLKRLLQ